MGLIVGAGMMKMVEELETERAAMYRTISYINKRIVEKNKEIQDLKIEAAHELR